MIHRSYFFYKYYLCKCYFITWEDVFGVAAISFALLKNFEHLYKDATELFTKTDGISSWEYL